MAQRLLRKSLMRISISQWQGRVATVFDAADDLLHVNIGNKIEISRKSYVLKKKTPLERALELGGLGTDVLICGAVSLVLENALNSINIQVHGFVRGDVEEVLEAFLNGRLMDERYLLPGRCSKP